MKKLKVGDEVRVKGTAKIKWIQDGWPWVELSNGLNGELWIHKNRLERVRR